MAGPRERLGEARSPSDFEPPGAGEAASLHTGHTEGTGKRRKQAKHRTLGGPVASFAYLAALAMLCVAGPLLTPYDPAATQFGERLSGTTIAHPLGTDHLGRDVLSRLLAGARLSLGLAAAAVAFSGAVGAALGLLAGRVGGVFAAAVNRTVDALIALPAILVGLTLVAIFDPGVATLFCAVALVGWMPFARLAHALTLKLGSREYVEAATVMGSGECRLVLRHILPNAAGPLLSLACLQFAYTLLTISGLSFLGLGAQPPTPEWGVMLSEGQPYLADSPLLVLAPAAAIVAAALTVTAAGRALAQRWEIHE